MTEDYGLQVSLSLPPREQYAKGDMLNIRGKTPAEFKKNLAAARELAREDALIARFFENAEAETLEKVKDALGATEDPAASAPAASAEVPATPTAPATDGASSTPAQVLSGMTEKQRGLVFGLARRKNVEDDRLLALASAAHGSRVSMVTDLTKKEASALIDTLQEL